MDKSETPKKQLPEKDRKAIARVVFGLHAMHRLADEAIGSLGINECEDGADQYMTAVKDLCRTYGKELDACLGRLDGPGSRCEVFDDEEEDETKDEEAEKGAAT